MDPTATLVELEELVARIANGSLLGVPPDYSNVPMAATRALIRRGARGLHLLATPVSGMQSDLLIGAGCVASVEAAAVSLGESGPAPRFNEAVRSGAIVIKDASCPAIHAGLQASEKGVPFMPLRGLIGSDLLKHRPDWRVIDSPFGEDDAIVLLPALRPDIALFHARWADRAGNVWLGRRRELVTLGHAARETLVTVEELFEGDLMADEITAAGTLPALYVSALAQARRGAWPLGLAGCYAADAGHLEEYAELARTAEGFRRYLERYVLAKPEAA